MDMTFEQWAQQPGAVEFIGMLKVYTDRGLSLEAACEVVRKNWLTLLKNVTDGLSRDTSRMCEPAHALKRHLADELWDAVNGHSKFANTECNHEPAHSRGM